MTDAISLEKVSKRFGQKVAVDELSFAVPAGALCGFIGPNGAGKTTTIRMIMSILLPDSGSLRVLGLPSALAAKDRTGYLPEERGLYKKMKVGSFLRYLGRLKGLGGPSLDKRVRDWLEKVDLRDVERKRCEDLSKGMQQKLQFVVAVLHEPELLILDEPFSGLDPINMRLLRELIAEQHQRGATIIFSTHVMVHAEQICDHILMIDEGRKVLDDTLANIRRRHDPRTILVEPLDSSSDPALLRELPGVTDVSPNDDHYLVHLDEGFDVATAIRDIVGRLDTARVEVQRPTLEDIFIQTVQAGARRDRSRELREALR